MLTMCTDLKELESFLKLDYANNLYFFTYIDELRNKNSDITILVEKINGTIILSLLLTPTHCSISSTSAEYIDLIAEQLPPINSVHIVGQSDQVKKLINVSSGPTREMHSYSLCKLNLSSLPFIDLTNSKKATYSDLPNLIEFYKNNEMLINFKTRLPQILTWGNAYFVQMDDEIISCALTTTETNDAAMLGAVFTNLDYRNKGYSKECIISLCQELVLNNKVPYLFYASDNLLLTRLYEAIGFKQVDNWILATRNDTL